MSNSDLSEFRSEASELNSEPGREGRGPMSSVADAQNITRTLGDMLAPHQGWQQKVSAVYRGLTSDEFEWRIDELSWNRVKSWLFGEARRIDYDHMVALKELKAHEEARRARLKLAATANILAAHLAAEGAPLDGRQMRALGRLARELDLSGTGGDAR